MPWADGAAANGPVWMGPVSPRSRAGAELALRLPDKRPVGNYTKTAFVGPVRLVGGQEAWGSR